MSLFSLAELCFMINPSFEYPPSIQNDKDEETRLQMSNNDFPAVGLFAKEPYKWEVLYQSIVRELIKGDKGSVNGLKILINMLR